MKTIKYAVEELILWPMLVSVTPTPEFVALVVEQSKVDSEDMFLKQVKLITGRDDVQVEFDEEIQNCVSILLTFKDEEAYKDYYECA